MSSFDTALAAAFDLYRKGDLAGATAASRRLLAQKRHDPRLSALAGMVALQSGAAGEAVSYLRQALAATPDSLPLRINLAFALVQTGQLDEARTVASRGDDVALWRIVAFVDQQQGHDPAAIRGFRRVLAAFPQDYESWSNLGVLLFRKDDVAGAEAAFRQALALNPADRDTCLHLETLLDGLGRQAERQALLRDAVGRVPDDADLLVRLGLAEGAMDDFAAAEAAYLAALRLAPLYPLAYLEYGMLLERLNRLDDLDHLIAQAGTRGVAGAEIDYLAAWALRRAGRFAEAGSRARKIDGGIDPGRLAQLRGEIADALGDTDAAFAAFTAMNDASAATAASARARASGFPDEVAATIRRLAPASVAGWTTASPVASSPAPIFIVGFPRSGTTLLDTLLMNAPELHVMEEVPVVERLEKRLGDPARIATLSDDEATELRAAYFEIQQEFSPRASVHQRVVDKFPINMVRAALIHRIFPDARFVFVERHPCDAVLSCFISRFQINRAMVHFQDLAAAARLYDLASTAWHATVDRLPIRVHRVRYERMVTDLAPELRAMLDFIDVPWRDGMMDNRGAARKRQHIATPSYSQVTKPLYASAIGRWTRYRTQMSPVIPVLHPWIERMGYAL
ncbi:tetratricopeptide repeat-containing sulfotransferase family protein [Sphingomonas solaris]|uniref:Tetratricopeptide repeat protein n=1 Tax=Alterirhizorhabdus solaris TaxID=2529389 RepID=A0A558R573_9SPHN|nr:sulfotransferase [Sphingomonas solaris]TVV74498.1 tetratricopeptide repeat protein [Sphingomonas solaris]